MTDTEAIALRANSATPGPWVVQSPDDDSHCYIDTHAHPEGPEPVVPPVGSTYSVTPADAEFIAHARSDIPELLARVAELENDKRRLVYVQTGSYHMAPWVHEMWPEWAGEWEARINAERAASPGPKP